VVSTPPDKQGQVHPAILFAAQLLGINKIAKIGGAQAVAALAFGTETVPAVYKIFGPGNQYVTVAKQMVTKMGVAIDMPAGPSEVLVMADETADASFVAADLLSQAEHGPDSQVVVVTDSERLLEQVQAALDQQLAQLPRREIAAKALANSLGVVLPDVNQMLAFSNRYAPEHLILAVRDFEFVAQGVTNAGSVFLGNYSPESFGDYASGTNHTLPTNGYARAYSGVSLDSFVKKITFQKISARGLQELGQTVEIMAAAEGLEAHKRAVSIRLDQLGVVSDC
jgi:histidinol dehydrogenase